MIAESGMQYFTEHLAHRIVRVLLVAGLALAGCATPAERADREATRLGLVRTNIRGLGFLHAVYAPGSERAALLPSSTPLHVYIGGDGSPLGALRWKPADPTPEPLMLRLMTLDAAPRVYLGRPCYHAATPCNSWFLTLGRYSDEVVASMAAALEKLRDRGRPVVLLGHSGGGTLAMLLAARVEGVRAVVTLGGNLDVGAWTRHHGFLPLRGSLDPCLAGPLPARIRQLHVAGGRDQIVPQELIETAAKRQPGARFRVFPDVTHDGPWDAVWPLVLEELDVLLAPSQTQQPQNWSLAPSVTR